MKENTRREERKVQKKKLKEKRTKADTQEKRRERIKKLDGKTLVTIGPVLQTDKKHKNK